MKHLLITLPILLVIGLYQIAEARTQREYEFFRNVTEWTWPPLEVLDYKQVRAREICAMAKNKGFSEKECPLLVAHLITENGALAEDRHGDNGCSMGVIQWNTCVHEGMKVEKFFKNNPEWRDWRYQVTHYLNEITRRKAKYDSLTVALESWNFGGRPWYLQRIKSNVRVANSLLYNSL